VGFAVKSNVLVMDFIGKDMKPAPKLRDVEGDVEKFSEIYLEVIEKMRVLYQECKLIHADLSEYNMLYWDNKVYIIDVSQSVEHDHPHALDFLRRDIFNINEFFRRKKVHVFRDWNVFQFIVALGIPKGKEKEELEKIVDDYIHCEEENSKKSGENS
jgi:RIO kinase 1